MPEQRTPIDFHRLGFVCILIDYRGYGKKVGDFPWSESFSAL
jgi:alpha/beta superfamily hydrolase